MQSQAEILLKFSLDYSKIKVGKNSYTGRVDDKNDKKLME